MVAVTQPRAVVEPRAAAALGVAGDEVLLEFDRFGAAGGRHAVATEGGEGGERLLVADAVVNEHGSRLAGPSSGAIGGERPHGGPSRGSNRRGRWQRGGSEAHTKDWLGLAGGAFGRSRPAGMPAPA